MRRRVLAAVLVVIGLLTLLLFAAQAWLSTGIGRGVLESRLSAAFGRPVRLDGEFEVGILPVPGASGTGLKLFTRDGRWLVVDAGSFLARLALRPLLKGEVEVTALRLGAAAIDLGRLASEPPLEQQAGRQPAPGNFFRIPDIRSFELEDISLYFEGMGSQPKVYISRMSINDFMLDAPAPFEAKVSVVSEGADLASVVADGTLTLWAAGVAEANLARLDLAVPGWAINELEGGLSADFVRAIFGIGLETNQPGRELSVGGIVAWQPGFAGYRIEEFDLVSGPQHLGGTGCLLDATPPILHVEASSQSLDLDAVSALVDSWRVPAAGGGALADGAHGGEAQSEQLPFDLAFRLDVDQAAYGGAVAEGIVLSAGGQPKCP